ncbi:MAG: decaprenyl-phosphate phosphoribosyltransferase [Anaerolineaceae bacterium]|nr:decaprenyl-phosphate phosphoribosyltransferase [Anaerolineaceae bacterium]
MKKLFASPYLHQMRPRQYAKNAFIFAPLFFDRQLFNTRSLLLTLAGFFTLCILCSGVYVLNDLVDVESDRNHPQKKYRPIASGKISIRNAKIFCVILFAAAFTLSFILSKKFFLLCVLMALINIAYSFKLKHIPLIDIITIGILFLIRVYSGAVLIRVKIFSPWLYIVTFMLALYLGFGKRRAELASLQGSENNTRPVLDGYTVPFLDQLISIISAVIIISYALYSFSGPAVPSNNRMLLTVPFVIYGIFRYLYLIQVKHQGGAPEEVLFSDRWLQGTIILYAISVVFALYF